MNGWNHELPKGSEIMCSGKSEHFLPHMWHPSRLTQITGNQSYVTVSEQTIQHNNVKQSCQICEKHHFSKPHITHCHKQLSRPHFTPDVKMFCAISEQRRGLELSLSLWRGSTQHIQHNTKTWARELGFDFCHSVKRFGLTSVEWKHADIYRHTDIGIVYWDGVSVPSWFCHPVIKQMPPMFQLADQARLNR